MVPLTTKRPVVAFLSTLAILTALARNTVVCQATVANPQVPAAQEQALAAMARLDQDFLDPTTGFFDVTGGTAEKAAALWPTSQALTAAVAVARLTRAPEDLARVHQIITALGAYASPAGGYQVRIVHSERYYDDNNWVALALLDAYDLLHDPAILARVENIYAFTMSGWDPNGGGIRWSMHSDDRPTAATAPAITVGVRLAMITHNPAYRTFADALYSWENATLRDPSGLYWDSLHADGSIDRDIVSYNQADMIEANLAYYTLTGWQEYLQQAVQIATLTNAAIPAPWQSRGMFADFDGLYLRALCDLHALVPAVSMQIAQDYAAWSWSIAGTPRLADNQRTQDGLLEQAGFVLAATAAAAA